MNVFTGRFEFAEDLSDTDSEIIFDEFVIFYRELCIKSEKIFQ